MKEVEVILPVGVIELSHDIVDIELPQKHLYHGGIVIIPKASIVDITFQNLILELKQ